jgi:hypothetical protein
VAPSLKKHCFRTPWKQCGNNETGNNRKQLKNKADQSRNNPGNNPGNKETIPSRGGDLVSPLARGHTLHNIPSRTGGATPWGLRLPGSHYYLDPSNILPNRLDLHSTDSIGDHLHDEGGLSSVPQLIDTCISTWVASYTL